ncbi:Protein WVD2-like 5 [Linum perenne]
MDMDGLLVNGSEMACRNGDHEYNPGEVDVVSSNMNGAVGKTLEPKGPHQYEENELKLDFDAVTIEDSDVHVEDSVAKEGVGVKDADHSGKAQSTNGLGKSKNEKPLSQKKASGTQPLKSRDTKGVAQPTVANGAPALNSRAKQSSKSNSSLNEKQVQTIKQQTGKSEAAPSETVVKKTTLKPLKKAHVAKPEEDLQSASPTESEIRTRREGGLPNYGFSFKCDERAEKRREFYTKLGEKIQAKEVEKNTMQAKSKESQEAELRQLRKSLNFKATPMPTFYQEPPPPRTELKKVNIPTTRPKSPKLGRRKSSSPADAEGNNNKTNGSGRLSLDARVIQTTTSTTKDVAPVVPKKQPRKSLPRLPSQKTSLIKNNQKTGAPKAAQDDSSTSSKQQLNETCHLPPPRATVTEIEPEDEQEQGETTVQEVIEAER